MARAQRLGERERGGLSARRPPCRWRASRSGRGRGASRRVPRPVQTGRAAGPVLTRRARLRTGPAPHPPRVACRRRRRPAPAPVPRAALPLPPARMLPPATNPLISQHALSPLAQTMFCTCAAAATVCPPVRATAPQRPCAPAPRVPRRYRTGRGGTERAAAAGEVLQRSVERLDLRAGAPRAAWRPAPPMLYTRFAPGACALGGDLFVAGGWGTLGDASERGVHAPAALDSVEARPRPPSRTNRTRLVPPPVLIGHVSSLLPY